MTSIPEDEFDAKFKPVESPGQQSGSHIWERKEVLAALAAGTYTEQQVWTVVDDGDGGMGQAAGWHIVNRLGYGITEVPWVDGTEYVEYDMPHSCYYCGSPIEMLNGSWDDGVDGTDCDDSPSKVHSDDEVDEDGAPCCPDPGCGRNPCTFPGYAANH